MGDVIDLRPRARPDKCLREAMADGIAVTLNELGYDRRDIADAVAIEVEKAFDSIDGGFVCTLTLGELSEECEPTITKAIEQMRTHYAETHRKVMLELARLAHTATCATALMLSK